MSVKDHSSADDQALVRAAQKGDMEPFEELVARHRDKIYARAFSMMRNEEEAIDLSQEAWVKGWQRLAQFQGESSFGTWMTRIVINLCLDQLRKQKRQRTESIERSEEHTSELHHVAISYAVFCLKKKKKHVRAVLGIRRSVVECEARRRRIERRVRRRVEETVRSSRRWRRPGCRRCC